MRMYIYVKCLTGKVVTLDVEPRNTIADVRDKLMHKEGYPQESGYGLICTGGMLLLNSYTLGDYGILGGSTIYIVLRHKLNDKGE